MSKHAEPNVNSASRFCFDALFSITIMSPVQEAKPASRVLPFAGNTPQPKYKFRSDEKRYVLATERLHLTSPAPGSGAQRAFGRADCLTAGGVSRGHGRSAAAHSSVAAESAGLDSAYRVPACMTG